jgi:hypothetical protein
MPFQRQIAASLARIGAGKGQEDQRVFQPLGLVHGDHLHQIGVAFQAQLARVAASARGIAPLLLGEMANQRVLAVEQRARLLQQFGKMQHVGQDAFAVDRPARIIAARARAAAPARENR